MNIWNYENNLLPLCNEKLFIPIDRIVDVFTIGDKPIIVYTARRTYISDSDIYPKWSKNGVSGYYRITDGIYA